MAKTLLSPVEPEFSVKHWVRATEEFPVVPEDDML
jgi:hypothetical protein